jgi:hypothetical protein
MNQSDDQRAQEISNLKLAVATFALRLDAFEARMRRLTKTNPEPSKLSSPDIGLAKQVPSQ